MWKNRERTEDELIARHVRALVTDHGNAVDSLLVSIEFDPATREEIWSEVFTIAYGRIDQLTGLDHGQTRGWLLRTARYVTANTARRAITRRKLQARLSQDGQLSEPSAEDSYFDSHLHADTPGSDAVRAAWAKISVAHQQVLELDAQGHDGPAIADVLGITSTAARSRLMRARRAFLTAHDRTEVDSL